MFACGGLTCLVCLWLGLQVAHPYALATDLRVRNDADERELLQLRLENQRAMKEVSALQTDKGVMQEARKRFGWTLPNERRLHLPPSDNAPSR